MGIIVNHNIGELIEHTCGGSYKVIGYEYIESRGVRYICIGDGSLEYRYFLEYELKPSEQSNIIGFSTTKASQTL